MKGSGSVSNDGLNYRERKWKGWWFNRMENGGGSGTVLSFINFLLFI